MGILNGTCTYCEMPGQHSKGGPWGYACVGCKGTLTKWFRSGKYDKVTLKSARYDAIKGWVIGEDGQG